MTSELLLIYIIDRVNIVYNIFLDWPGGERWLPTESSHRSVRTVTAMLRTSIILILRQLIYFIHDIDFLIADLNSFNYRSYNISLAMQN